MFTSQAKLTSTCSLQDTWWPSIVTALPTYFRLLQCLRRFHDHPIPHPFLTNAFKYLIGVFTIIWGIYSRTHENNDFKYLFTGFSIFSTLISFVWDIYFDWGLVKNGKLRSVIIFPAWTYILAAILNMVFRLTTLLVLAPSYWDSIYLGQSFALLISVFEGLRRCIWATIRIENEHTRNISAFLTVDDVALPYRIGTSADVVLKEVIY